MKINLGCGRKILDSYVNVDVGDYGQDIVMDGLEYLSGLEPDSVDEIIAHHFLEHFVSKDVQKYLNIIHAVLRPNGTFYVVVPHKDRDRAWILTHKTFYTEATFKNLEVEAQAKDYDFELWKINKIVTNNRKDIHCWMSPIK